MSVSCILIDDDLSTICIVESYLKKLPGILLKGVFFSFIEATSFLESKIDILFVNEIVFEPEHLNILRSLNSQPTIVLLTSNEEYVLDSSKVGAVDVLIKPLCFGCFKRCMLRLLERLYGKTELFDTEREYVFLKENNKMSKVRLEDIYYVESLKDYIVVHTRNKSVTTRITMACFQNLLGYAKYLRIHKSFIIAIDKIESFSSNIIEIGDVSLPVGRTYKKQVLLLLNDTFGCELHLNSLV